VAHENLSREHVVEGSSDRTFGLVLAAFFSIIGMWPMLHAGVPRWWAFVIAAVFALVALLKPSLASGLNRQWTRLGLLLGRIVSPIALGVLYFSVVTPVGIAMRLTGKDPLLLKRDPGAASYWQPRQPPGPPADSMTQQF
jgi:Saxitoxin biosynthesis operon protein SxtJ